MVSLMDSTPWYHPIPLKQLCVRMYVLPYVSRMVCTASIISVLKENIPSNRDLLLTCLLHIIQKSPQSLNALIDKELCSLSYIRINDAITIIKCLGAGAWMYKADMTDAFKMVNIHSDLWYRHGVQWSGLMYFVTWLVFGYFQGRQFYGPCLNFNRLYISLSGWILYCIDEIIPHCHDMACILWGHE